MPKFLLLALFTPFTLFTLVSCNTIPSQPVSNIISVSKKVSPRHQRYGKEIAIASQGVHSTKIGKQIFAQGGNVIDIAVAMSFALAVERPQSTGIGGGGFMLYHHASSDRTYALDFRERAPRLASNRLYLDANGKVIADKSRQGGAAVATPGLVAGLLAAHARFGKLPRAKVLQPAIELAQNGFPVYDHLAKAMRVKSKLLAQDQYAAAIFLHPDASPYRIGETLKQPQLAATLRAIAKHGHAGFYRGAVAAAIIASVKKHGGVMQLDDLHSYHVSWRAPIAVKLRDYRLLSMPLPSSGGILIAQMLQVLENFNLRQLSPAIATNIVAQSMQNAFADRAMHLGDRDFVEVPEERLLISRRYANRIATEITADRSRKSETIQSKAKLESGSTTHFSVVDKHGNAVSSTQTINGWFGAGIVAADTGIVLNNEMDDFSVKTGVANMFGALGNRRNYVQAYKRPLSSMSPTIVMRGKSLLALGSPAGTRIISCVLQTILNFYTYRFNLYQAVATPRFHHQWQPDLLVLEKDMSASVVSKLQQMGYTTKQTDALGCSVQASALHAPNRLEAVSDPRGYGLAFAL